MSPSWSSGTDGRGRVTSDMAAEQLIVSFEGESGAGRAPVTIEETRAVLGRSEECEIYLEGETVSRAHCEIRRLGGVFLITDHSRNGTYVNGRRIKECRLGDGDLIRIGPNLLRARLNSGRTTGMLGGKETVPHQPSALVGLTPRIVVKGLEEGVTQQFSEERITLGRRAENQLVLAGEKISRDHAAVVREDGLYFLIDLGSANGTYVNDRRIERAPLAEGDRIRLGNYLCQVGFRGQDCLLHFRKITS